jgi:hypothetical protein
MKCGLHNIWALIRRLSLKAKKVDDKWHTCEEWIEEYYENKRSKDLHSIFNGRKVFNSLELSANMVAEELGVHKNSVIYYIRTGRLKSFRRGQYHVVDRAELDRFIAEEMCEKDVEQNA